MMDRAIIDSIKRDMASSEECISECDKMILECKLDIIQLQSMMSRYEDVKERAMLLLAQDKALLDVAMKYSL